MGRNKIKSNKTVILVICFTFMMGALALFLYAVFTQKETVMVAKESDQKLSVLECKTSMEPKDLFFAEQEAISETHKIKITIDGDKVGKIAYEYWGKFEDDEKAKQMNAAMHATYNIYMGTHMTDLSTTFGSSNAESRVTIYADAGRMNNLVAPIFFLTEQEGIDFYSYSEATLKTIYTAQGFLCEIKN